MDILFIFSIIKFEIVRITFRKTSSVNIIDIAKMTDYGINVQESTGEQIVSAIPNNSLLLTTIEPNTPLGNEIKVNNGGGFILYKFNEWRFIGLCVITGGDNNLYVARPDSVNRPIWLKIELQSII